MQIIFDIYLNQGNEIKKVVATYLYRWVGSLPSRVADPVWYWPDPDPDQTSQDKPDPDQDPDPDPTSQDKPDLDPDSDPDTFVLKIFHLIHDEF